jgi:SAM-dependent methyltransferase
MDPALLPSIRDGVPCRLCGAVARPLGDRGDVSLHRCPRCSFVTGCPSEDRSADARYEGYYHAPQPPAPRARYCEWLEHAEREVGRARLLEVGAGAGGLVRVALERGWTVDATEISTSGVALLRQTSARVFAGDLMSARYEPGTFDLVVCLEVVEHMAEPAAEFHELQRVLRPGGLLLLTTPNLTASREGR